MLTKATLAVGLIALLAVPVQAQQRDQFAASREGVPSSWNWQAGYAASPTRWVVDFYIVPGATLPEGPSRFVARRKLDAIDGPEQFAWADTENCPAIYTVLEALQAVTPPEIRVPDLTRRAGPKPTFNEPTPAPPDGGLFEIWGKAVQADGAMSSTMMSSSHGLIARWVQYAEAELRECWSDHRT